MTFLFYHYLEKTAEEKTANVAKKLVSGAISAGGKMLKNDWRQMGQGSWGRFNQAMTVLPAALTVPGLANKYDDQGRSRAERLTSLGGNIAGGMVGNQMGNRMGSSIAKTLGGGKIGRGLGFAASMAGGVGGSIAGETIASSPFKALSKPAPQPQYGLNANNPPNPQSSYPSSALNQQ